MPARIGVHRRAAVRRALSQGLDQGPRPGHAAVRAVPRPSGRAVRDGRQPPRLQRLAVRARVHPDQGRHRAGLRDHLAPLAHQMARLKLDLHRYERTLHADGFRHIAGADEAGRGALAGPLVAAAVILPEGFDCEGLTDSKLLTPGLRDEWFGRITAVAISVAVCRTFPRRMDHRGLHVSNLALLRAAVR